MGTSSNLGGSAVNEQLDAGDEAGIVGGEEKRGCGERAIPEVAAV